MRHSLLCPAIGFSKRRIILFFTLSFMFFSCKEEKVQAILHATDILGNPDYPAISYGGYRNRDHGIEPTLAELKEDMLILHAMGVRVLRTYKVHLPHAANVLQAIKELKELRPDFEMYVMLGAWIDCKNAWTDLEPIHNEESERNEREISEAIRLANTYPDIVKIIAVGNEAMVKWAASYYVEPWIILKWVNYLQGMKSKGELSKDLWITSSDNFASWGGGGAEYHVEDLVKLIEAVDFLSIHTYPMHDTHYNPKFWGIPEGMANAEKMTQIEVVMDSALGYAKQQYQNVKSYVEQLGLQKPIHIGETGWASSSDGFYGPKGSKACDELKAGLYYKKMRAWTQEEGISCFYFEGFDEPWKDAQNPEGSENHFGLFTVDGLAKYPLWEMVDQGIFNNLKRGANQVKKTRNGDFQALLDAAMIPPIKTITDKK